MQHRLITPTTATLTKPVCWNNLSFTSVSSLWGAKTHFRTHQLIIKRVSSEHCIPLWSRWSTWKASNLLLSISAPSAVCLPSPLTIPILEQRSHIETCLWALIYLNQNKAWADLSRQQNKPHKDYWRQYLHADYTIVLGRKIALTYFTHM